MDLTPRTFEVSLTLGLARYRRYYWWFSYGAGSTVDDAGRLEHWATLVVAGFRFTLTRTMDEDE